MRYQRHDSGRFLGVRIQLLELVDGTIAIFHGSVMLHGDHRHIIALLGVGDVYDGPGARGQANRPVVEHPIANVVVAILLQDVGRLPGLGKAGSQPAARTAAT